jgi:hypothetical protein
MVAGGLYVVVGLPLAWLPNNSPRYGKRTTATGMQLTIGNCAGILSSFIYPAADKPRYVMGHAVTLSMVGFACTVYAIAVSRVLTWGVLYADLCCSGLYTHVQIRGGMPDWRITKLRG